MDRLLNIGKAQAYWNVSSTRVLKYVVEISHKGLNEHKLISAPELSMLENKVNLQCRKWTDKWKAVESKNMASQEKEANLEEANKKTEEAQQAITEIGDLLSRTLSVDDAVNWENLKKKEEFAEKKPSRPANPIYKELPNKPDKESEQFVPKFNILEKIFKSWREQKIQEYEQVYSNAVSDWEKSVKRINEHNQKLGRENEEDVSRWNQEVAAWKERQEIYLQDQSDYNLKIDKMEKDYLNKNTDSIMEYCEMVLNNSSYPASFPKDFELEYNPENQILIVEYQLPPMESFPKVKEVKYLAGKKELKETLLPEAQINKMFDDAMYKIALRTIHELFEADKAIALQAISFNGWIRTINKATGKEENNCILSLQVKREEFLNVDLAKVDPKTCFKNLKGVASSKLSSLTPIQPVLQMSRVDKRFVESYAVANTIDEATNLAAMDWEDFEHLIRELFEKEFKSNGGEVKITQASRDGGVDAVVFDPDPIRGGKIVIQAKRYTNTVGVSAVRDLYGTVMNEGATKGILVTTADYGSDAYEFAKAKPLTLLNGSNLLHLLGKHGHHAKIDLKEAKKILDERG